MKHLLLLLILFYKKCIDPFKPKTCRFYPTCSDYMAEAIRKYGAFRGLYLGIKRLLKCHPFHPGGVDFVDKDSDNLS